ncbi:MAG: hypothetical protein U1E29_02615, partial [Coriobacteriia bacterium]|nr:hypothetical protein [Coriobacteriia bacterium]
LDEASRLAREHLSPSRAVQILGWYATELDRCGHTQDALAKRIERVEVARASDDPADLIGPLWSLADGNRRNGKGDEALACIAEALAVTQGADQARFLSLEAITLAAMGRPEDAVDSLSRATVGAEAAGEDDALAAVRARGAYVLALVGDTDAAKERITHACTTAAASDDPDSGFQYVDNVITDIRGVGLNELGDALEEVRNRFRS